ncbi:mediator of RNA polymerase II transcription subunit 15a-like isoform X3 [Olea europaea var. sylvestris]|uniref:mediator of RNA polymerase II transcription subunit 15a-like isoform X3 n=1 Tax=Olea europaea var. sylvestris TaxID=158386 RepID=UPI000C1D3EF7|nr:mediator of RNA polymerase II transcription subunit 15a-like isoform X3 [Olea europaea var. sylvestris]
MDMSGIWDQLQDIGGDADVADWRTGLDEDSRQRIVNKIIKIMMLRVYRTETLKRHLPFSGEEGLREIKKIAIRFEEKTFASAISQSAMCSCSQIT